MNLPNKLSLLRVLCIPAIVILTLLPGDFCRWSVVVLFALASVTDFFDGRIARSRNLVTDFGKFIDPLADKVLVLSCMILLVEKALLPAWAVVIVLTRELSVDGLRLIAATKGIIIAAAKLGKWKTFIQMLLILYLLVFRINVFSHFIGIILFSLSILLTIVSGIEYFSKNRSVFETK